MWSPFESIESVRDNSEREPVDNCESFLPKLELSESYLYVDIFELDSFEFFEILNVISETVLAFVKDIPEVVEIAESPLPLFFEYVTAFSEIGNLLSVSSVLDSVTEVVDAEETFEIFEI